MARSAPATIKDALRGRQVRVGLMPRTGGDSGKILRMKTSLLLTATLLCALPLIAQGSEQNVAQHPARRVSAVCGLTAASIVPSSRTVAPPAREYLLQVTNNSNRTVKLPRNPEFGWRVETKEKSGWKLRAEAGPVRLLKAEEQHIVSSATTGPGPLVEIEPAQSELFYFLLPDAKKALDPHRQVNRVRLSVYWSPSAQTVTSEPLVLPCALAATWVVDVLKSPPGE